MAPVLLNVTQKRHSATLTATIPPQGAAKPQLTIMTLVNPKEISQSCVGLHLQLGISQFQLLLIKSNDY
jgi:hypothetical protein